MATADLDGRHSDRFGTDEIGLAIVADHHGVGRFDTGQRGAEDGGFRLADDGDGGVRHRGPQGGEEDAGLDQRAGLATTIGTPWWAAVTSR